VPSSLVIVHSPETISPEGRKVLEGIHTRMKTAFTNDPDFAELFGQPLEEGEPEHPLLERMKAGDFR
jgi:hypothetical protein